MSFAKDIFLAEEIGKEISRNIKIPQQTNEVVIKTEEKRPRYPHTINYLIHEANRRYEIKFPIEGVKAWNLRCREDNDINYCFESSASTFITLSAGATLSQDTAPEGVHSIYVRCATANVTIELEIWKGAPSLDLEKEALLRLSP